MDDVYDFPSRPVPVELAELKVKRDGGGRRREGWWSKGVAGQGVRSAGRRETSKSRGPCVSSPTGLDWDWLRIAMRGTRESASAGRRGFPVVSMDAEKSEHRVGGWERVGGRLGGWGTGRRRRGVVFFQSSNLLNLFFPRNVAAVSKLLIAIGKVEPMGRGRGVELNGARRGRVRERESERVA